MTIASTTPARRKSQRAPGTHPRGLPWMVAAEFASGALGFAAAMHMARRLGPGDFAAVEWASAVAAWMLVVVRGGVETIVHREAGRHPRLIRTLTDLLLGMKGALALVGYAAILLIATGAGCERGGVLAIAGLILFPSALAADVAPRALGRLGVLAAVQGLRAFGYALAARSIVASTGKASRAAWCAVAAEALATLVLFRWHSARLGPTTPSFRARVWSALARRGAVASQTRFARVSLYGADVLALGWWAAAGLGPYAAARRVVFALVATGLVVPASLSPALAHAWAEGRESARRLVGDAVGWLVDLALPAAVGLTCTSARWMPVLFGADYRAGAPWLALIAARLPWLLAATFAQATLVACRREGRALGLVAGMSVLALAVVPVAAARGGPSGVGLAMLAIEMAGGIAGCWLLRDLGLAPNPVRLLRRPALGCLGLAVACFATRGDPLAFQCGAGALAYGLVWTMARREGVAC